LGAPTRLSRAFRFIGGGGQVPFAPFLVELRRDRRAASRRRGRRQAGHRTGERQTKRRDKSRATVPASSRTTRTTRCSCSRESLRGTMFGTNSIGTVQRGRNLKATSVPINANTSAVRRASGAKRWRCVARSRSLSARLAAAQRGLHDNRTREIKSKAGERPAFGRHRPRLRVQRR
jgi:hypothetical protein